jgi:hypothetical protein
MENQRNFINKPTFGNKANFGNKRVNVNRRINTNRNKTLIPNVQQNSTPTFVPNETINNSSNMVNIVIFTFVFLVVIYVIYVYGESIYNSVVEFIKSFTTGNSYYLIEDEESKKDKIKCVTGCNQGKCNSKEGLCKEDDDCMLCLDKDGSIYGAAPNKKDENKKVQQFEEEDIIQNKRIKELEEMIKERNKQIEDLNKYIEYVNKNKDKINKEKIKTIYEEENKEFIVKVNYS